MPQLNESSSVDLFASADSTLTLRSPSGGFVTVENPIGNVIWRGGEANRQLDIKSGSIRITANTRNSFYELQDDPVNGFQVLQDTATGALVGVGGRMDGLLPPTPPRVLKRMLDTVGVAAANSGTAATVTIDNASPFGRPALRVQLETGTTWHEVQLTGRNIANFDGHVVWRVWVGDHTQVLQIGAYAGTTGYTRLYQQLHRLSGSDRNRWNGEHAIVVGPAVADTANTFLTGQDTLNETKLRIFGTGVQTSVWVDAVFIPQRGRPTHVLTYDDCSVTWIANALPALAAAKLRATFCVNSGDIGGNPALYLSASQVQQLAAAGHEIASHNVTNTPVLDGSGAGTQTAAAYTADFVTGQAALSALVGSAFVSDYHAWVQGRNNQAAHDTMRAAGLRVGRGVDPGYNFPQLGLGNGVMALKIQQAHALTPTQMDAVIANADRYGATVIWMLHEITQNGGVGVETSIANHRYLCERLAEERDAGRAAVPAMGRLAQELYAGRLVASSLL